MVETLVVGLVVAAAFVVSGRYLFREVSGGKKGCGGGCGADCPLASACSCEPDAANTDQAPKGCPRTSSV
jgi:hypothetical protein